MVIWRLRQYRAASVTAKRFGAPASAQLSAIAPMQVREQAWSRPAQPRVKRAE